MEFRRVLFPSPPELPARFQPGEINLGYPLSPTEDAQLYEAAAMSGFGACGQSAAGDGGSAWETQPRPLCPSIATSIFQGAVPGGRILAKSIFETNVYETRGG